MLRIELVDEIALDLADDGLALGFLEGDLLHHIALPMPHASVERAM